MGFGTTFENKLNLFLLNNTTIANFGDATGLVGSSVAGSLFVALHTADPEAGDQNTSEVSYTGYARVAVARSGSGWAVVTSTGDNVAAVTFGKRTDVGTAVATHFSVGTLTSGTGMVVWAVTLTSSLSITQNVIPSFPIGLLDLIIS